MLENVNDYISLFSIILVLAMVAGLFIYFFNLKVIEKNIRKEVKYYDYQKPSNTKKEL
ncbi:MAG: hypothetical protein ACOX1F_07735 [Erysipelotrichaceae bacterium]|jgi:hypothetical protein